MHGTLRNVVDVAYQLLTFPILRQEIFDSVIWIGLVVHKGRTQVSTCTPHGVRLSTNVECSEHADRCSRAACTHFCPNSAQLLSKSCRDQASERGDTTEQDECNSEPCGDLVPRKKILINLSGG